MSELEQTLDSTEIADMIDKEHSKLLRDIRRYIEQFNEAKIGFADFFKESAYKDAKGETRPCYRITKKGCEFIAHKLTGTKGTIFTARYINRFHEMQDILSKKEVKLELPWFIRRFRGEYIMLFRDFETVTGISLHHSQPFWKAHADIMNSRRPLYYNGWGWYTVIGKEEFLEEYGFEYGDEKCMYYLYPCGIRKVLQICREDKRLKLEQSAYDMILNGMKTIESPEKEIAVKKTKPISISEKSGNQLPVQIKIIIGKEEIV